MYASGGSVVRQEGWTVGSLYGIRLRPYESLIQSRHNDISYVYIILLNYT